MSATQPAPARPVARPSDVGAGSLLRQWRTVRRLSQLQLALLAGVSSRHLSYVETGRSRPSRDMVLQLAHALEIPLRERNVILIAAGFAPRFYETGLDAPEMANVRSAIELILRHQEPYPAFVLDRYWNILETNNAASRCSRFLHGGEPTDRNMIRNLMRPDALRPVLVNWQETARDLIRHLHNQIAATPTDERARQLLNEVLTYPDVPAGWQNREIGTPTTPLLTTVFRKGDVELRFFSTFTFFGTPHDVTLDELRIESSFPADERTAAACSELFG